ncbi:uncharacterized protein LOC119112005 [Pollicipes pollicipes]|uniref:uncharacterized protein LOC119112005 n=1 Tax=Pollicipes pollicipes TaxID=41117 RepID=UPI0018858B21|nr:uncharacterized protein LOC119112005 [Pollicipes pollicipes]
MRPSVRFRVPVSCSPDVAHRSAWSPCDTNGEQHRERRCRAESESGVCFGARRQDRLCVQTSRQLSQPAPAFQVSGGHMIAACIGCFVTGAILAAAGMYFCLSRRRQVRIKSSKYYSSPQPQLAEPNPYVAIRDVHGVHELAELKNNSHKDSAAKYVGLPPVGFSDDASTVGRSGSGRFDSELSSDDDAGGWPGL